MPIASAERYVEMLDAAHEGGYAFPAVNVTSSQTLNAALRGFAEAGSDGIVEVNVGGAEYFSGGRDAAAGARGFAALAHEVARDLPVSVALHTDHCPPARVDDFLRPLLAEALFQSQMFDGSSLPLEENLRISAELLVECARAGVVLEVECGVVGGEEDGITGTVGARLYTTSEDLMRVAEVLGAGERGRYLLAATFGNVHGLHAPGRVRLRPEILREGQEALAAAHPGAHFDYVFHGSSGTAPPEIREAVGYGVVKVNVDSELQRAFTRAAATHFDRYGDGFGLDKRAYDPRTWGAAAEAAMAAEVARTCELLGSAGRSL
jgi:fructose-bisphosphate aldolase, class II